MLSSLVLKSLLVFGETGTSPFTASNSLASPAPKT